MSTAAAGRRAGSRAERVEANARALRAGGSAALAASCADARVIPARVRLLAGSSVLVGRAFCVRTASSDNLHLHWALNKATRGDVLMVQTVGTQRAGLWGALMTLASKQRGVSGLVLDGYVRDLAAVESMGFHVFARGTCVLDATKRLSASGEIGGTVRIGSAIVQTGDWVCADVDAVVVVPAARISFAAAVVRKRLAREQVLRRNLVRGKPLSVLLGLPAGG